METYLFTLPNSITTAKVCNAKNNGSKWSHSFFKLQYLGMLTQLLQGTIYSFFSERRGFSSINFIGKKSY